MTLHLLEKRLDELLLEKNLPTMVLEMVQFCESRGYVPRADSTTHMVITFFQGDELDLNTLIHEFGIPTLYAKAFLVDLRHLKKFNGI